jgi:hypothetical protein
MDIGGPDRERQHECGYGPIQSRRILLESHLHTAFCAPDPSAEQGLSGWLRTDPVQLKSNPAENCRS